MKKIRYSLNPYKFITSILILVIITCSMLYIIDFCKYTEKYCTTLKYQLKNDIASGNIEAIKHYNKIYISNGKVLFEK